jgi:hypothetical protein
LAPLLKLKLFYSWLRETFDLLSGEKAEFRTLECATFEKLFILIPLLEVPLTWVGFFSMLMTGVRELKGEIIWFPGFSIVENTPSVSLFLGDMNF